MTVILGLHKDPWHNTGAAVISSEGGEVRFATVGQERLDRVKNSRAFPGKAVEACLREMGAELADVDHVVVDYICDRDWRRDYHRVPCSTDTWLNRFDSSRVHVVNHHLAHGYSTFCSSGYQEAAVLVVDGRGSEKETQSLFSAGPTGLTLIESTRKIGIGLLYAAVTEAIGFGPLNEGKTMGLAPYGDGVGDQVFEFRRSFDGIATDYAPFCVEDTYEMAVPHRTLSTFEDRARAAFEVQEECEAAMLHLAAHAKEVTGARNLCISGGVGLNSVANYKILQSGLFDEVFINPACSDSGIPLGAALYGLHSVAGEPMNSELISPYLGPSYSREEMGAAISGAEGCVVHEDGAMARASTLLAENKIVACFQGRSEMGPRALGNRSILMSPLVAENKDVLNHRVKHREGFRPFAPAVLEQFAQDYYVIDRPSPYMLFVPEVQPDKRDVIPAVTHVDGTGRLQTVTKTFNEHFHQIVEAFYAATGVPVLLNTSFNVAGEPIVETPEDAVHCFLGTNIDALLIGESLLVKS